MGEKNWYRLKNNSLNWNLDNQCEKLSGWMKKNVVYEKLEVRKSGWKLLKKLITEKNFNCKIDVKN